MNRGGRVEPTPPECALAAEMFNHFCAAGTMKQILALHREICNTLKLRPNKLPNFYPKLKVKLASSWKAQALFKKFDARANHKVYGKGRICASTKVLIIGAGPCGLRAAIECQLLGAKVVVIEKRDRISRNNVLHLWPFVIQDLRALGAKKFFGKFCAGSIDHISIRQLQCILLKAALLLGVEFHEGVSFEELLEPTVTVNSETLGWRARVSPMNHPVSQYEFDVLLGADGKRNTLQGFKRNEFRGKLAMAITANFINRHTEEEATVPEISGVAFIFNQKFFKELYDVTGIDLENIVYYKDDTHYFVMTAKKHSLLDKGVLLNDYNEVSRLLSVENVDRAALMRYAQEAARFSTDGKLPLKDFALNHYGEPDVALFDFTSMYAAENASMVYERHGRRNLCQLVGDSLLEPFWPTGSGCARGFLSALDAAWTVRSWGQNPSADPLEIIAERESVYRLLAQTTPENLHRDFGAYTLDPGTRYPNLNRTAVPAHRVVSFYDTDEPYPLDAASTARKRRRELEVADEALIDWVASPEPGLRGAASPTSLTNLLRRYRPDLLPSDLLSVPVYQVFHDEFGIPPFSASGSLRDVTDSKLRSYLLRVYTAFKGEVPHIYHESDVFDEIKQTQEKEKYVCNTIDYPIAVYADAADADRLHSSCRKKRRSLKTTQVSIDLTEDIRKKIAKLDLNNITKIANLIEGHDALTDDERHANKQKEFQEQILALLDPEESPDPKVLRQSLTQLFEGPTNIRVKSYSNILKFFPNEQEKPITPSRKLKGLDPSTIRKSDLDNFDNSSDTDATVVGADTNKSGVFVLKNKRSWSSENSVNVKRERRFSDLLNKRRNSQNDFYKRSNSIEVGEIANTKRIVDIFEGNKRHTSSPEANLARSDSLTNPEMALRLQWWTKIMDGKIRDPASTDRMILDSIGSPEMALRRQKIDDFIQGSKPRPPEPTQGRNSGEMSFRMQRVSDKMQKRSGEGRSSKTMSRRKAAREIMRQRFEKSLQMLASESRMDFAPSADLENDYGLQQYRANAPDFNERVKKLEQKLQHYEEGRIVGGGSRTAGGGARVARLAAELSGTTANTDSIRMPSKPKDLIRSVGKIEPDDWNMKKIERKIQENKLGRPEPKTAEKVPKWDREQFLGRQRRLKEGEGSEKWVEIDETLHKLDQKLRDSGRPHHGTNKVANLATKFVKKDEPQPKQQQQQKEEAKKSWRVPAPSGIQCVACGTRVFAAEGITADGLHLHRACFRCAVCKTVLRPGNYTMERDGGRLVCLRHSGVNTPDAVTAAATSAVPTRPYLGQISNQTPERISVELSDSGAREIDEDEWTDRNFLASETSGAGGLSDEEDSSTEEYTDANGSEIEEEHSPEPQGVAEPCPVQGPSVYFSDDSFGYDDYSDDGAVSSGNESCSRMRAAREARRLEVPADNQLPTDSSEVESEEESESSDEEISSATEVSTDSEFAREECAPAPMPPAILVTEATPPVPAPATQDYPLSRTRSAGGLATKRALELKRKYLLGEPSPPAVRKSDSTSQMDTKFEAFRSTITEFQKLLHPATTSVTPTTQKSVVTFQMSENVKPQPMPDIIKNLCNDAPVDLLTKGDSTLCKDWRSEEVNVDKKEADVESDSLSDDSSQTETVPNQTVPRVEVHNEGGELIQLDSLTIITSNTEDNEKASGTATSTDPTVIAAESESSESCRDATTLALTETELSDWAAESVVLDDCGYDDKEEGRRSKNPRQLSGPKLIHDAKNVSALASHVCGRKSPSETVVYSNAVDHFEFADEGEQDPTIERPITPKNLGYMELVDDDYAYSVSNDRSMNFIEKNYSETVLKSASQDVSVHQEKHIPETNFENNTKLEKPSQHIKSPEISIAVDNEPSDKSTSDRQSIESIKNDKYNVELIIERLSLNDKPTPVERDDKIESIDNKSPPLVTKTPKYHVITPNTSITFTSPCSIRLYAPAICRSASETFHSPNTRSVDSSPGKIKVPMVVTYSSGSKSPASPVTERDMTDKVQEIKRKREEQTELVRRLVLERLGKGLQMSKKSSRRTRASPCCGVPPPVPPPPTLPPPPPATPPPPPRPAPPHVSVQVTASFSDPELARERRRKSIMKSISNYLNRRIGPRHKWVSEPELTWHETQQRITNSHKSTGALQEAPPVPPPPVHYSPPEALRSQLPRASAEQQAATVAELVQVSAQRDAHLALRAADRRRSAGGSVVGD